MKSLTERLAEKSNARTELRLHLSMFDDDQPVDVEAARMLMSALHEYLKDDALLDSDMAQAVGR